MPSTSEKWDILGSSHRENLIGRQLRDGEYLVQRIVGHGGMGRVYLATHTALAIPLALKQARADQPLPESVVAELDDILHGGNSTYRTNQRDTPEYDFPSSGGPLTDRFLREALLLARLHHPAIPTLYDYFFEDGYWYLVMDYIPGLTLTAYLRQHRLLLPLEVLSYSIQLCDVLDYLHNQTPPIIFRDLKPSNIILTPEGSLMLVDFGIARYFKAGQVNDTTDFGSPGYAAPEQYQMAEQTDARSDLFSLGVIVHEMISGQRPTRSGTTHPAPLRSQPGVSAILNGTIALATRADALDRFQSAHTFNLALERAYQIEERRAYQSKIKTPTEVALINHDHADPEATHPPTNHQTRNLSLPSTPLHTPDTSLIPSNDTPNLSNSSPSLPVPPLNMEQRSQTREALQQARHIRLEHETLEIQLASVDESLKRRSFKALSQTPRLPIEEEDLAQPEPVYEPIHTQSSPSQLILSPSLPLSPLSPLAPVSSPSRYALNRAIRASFALALILFLLLSSLLTYLQFSNHPESISQGTTPSIGSTPSLIGHITPITMSTWQALPSLPSSEADNAAVYANMQGRTDIYLSGGYRNSLHAPYYDHNLYHYDIMSAHWEVISNAHLPGMLNNAAAVDKHGDIFFTGGYSTDTYIVTSTLYEYQLSRGALQSITPPSQISIGFGGTMIADQQDHLYIIQGFNKGGDPHALAGTGWYRYDIDSGHWHVLASLPLGLAYGLLAPNDNGDILLLGGAQEAGQHLQTNKIYRYNMAQNAWTQEPTTTPIPLSGVSGCQVHQGLMAIVGGYDALHGTGMDQVWLVNLQTLQWQQLQPLPAGGSVMGVATCDGMGHLYLERGGTDPNHPTPDFWELTVP